ncbi:unnamed protein product [Hermetia illucens]|uniref:Gustatory receptor n=1 Tax=Hermetia illucens TaxID=343691 RepID=A0A7R8UU77_HERIL|nr:unnamed protein product [Hermetia illucens]
MEPSSASFIHLRIMQLVGYTQLYYCPKRQNLVRSNILVVYSIILCMVVITWLIYNLVDIEAHWRSLEINSVMETIEYINLIGSGAGYINSIVQSIIHCDKHLKHFKKTMEINKLFKQVLKVYVPWERLRKRLGTVAGGMFLTSFAATAYILMIALYMKWYYYIRYWLLYRILYNFCSLRYFESYMVVSAFKWTFDYLNKCLQELSFLGGKHMDAYEKKNRKFGLYLTEMNYQKQSHKNSVYFRFKILRNIYHLQWELSKVFNDIFGLSLLVNIASDFLSFLTLTYWMLTTMTTFSMALVDVVALFGFLICLVPHLLNLILICRICYLTTQSVMVMFFQASRTALFVHKIPHDPTNESHIMQIEEFSLQLLHQRITFSAFGFFNIDMNLLYTIIGATATYLIISIQFYLSAQRG